MPHYSGPGGHRNCAPSYGDEHSISLKLQAKLDRIDAYRREERYKQQRGIVDEKGQPWLCTGCGKYIGGGAVHWQHVEWPLGAYTPTFKTTYAFCSEKCVKEKFPYWYTTYYRSERK